MVPMELIREILSRVTHVHLFTDGYKDEERDMLGGIY